MAIQINAQLLAKLHTSIELINGPATFSNDREAFGYIKEAEKLQVPTWLVYGYDYFSQRNTARDGFNDTEINVLQPTIVNEDGNLVEDFDVRNLSGADVLLILAAINIGYSGTGQDASLGALIRGILVARGVLFPMPDTSDRSTFTPATRCVFHDEVTTVLNGEVVTRLRTNINEVLTLVTSDKGQHLLQNWVAISLPVDYVFMARTHHFVGEDNANIVVANRQQEDKAGFYSYSQIYRAIWRSAFPEVPFPVDDAKKLWRTALHPFGVNSFRLLEKVYRESEKLPSGMLARARPAPAGVAKITTASAILKMMEGSPFFLTVRNVIQATARDIHDMAKLIRDSPERFHQHHILYGSQGLTSDEKQAVQYVTDIANGLAPLLVGYVEVECRGAPIASQKTLNRPAADQAGLLNRVRRMFTRLDAMADQDDPVDVVTRMIAPGNFASRGSSIAQPTTTQLVIGGPTITQPAPSAPVRPSAPVSVPPPERPGFLARTLRAIGFQPTGSPLASSAADPKGKGRAAEQDDEVA